MRLLSGELAVKKKSCLPMKITDTTGDPRGDIEKAWQLAEELRPSDPRGWFMQAVFDSIFWVNKNWTAIEQLASAIETDESLEGEEVLRIIEKAGFQQVDSSNPDPAPLKKDSA